ncbi:hypothetical protein PtA15_1A308 [Puccinia triticina]|uniref:Uncharacterized protein n=1 Tax=Puccinia triticina TaxID=208348 RepID=A0ABY7C847_9BASI|nr:uncharacterized protein PtA15_1A308 [Puccinia triticina]WAQ80970.1 hypothetical protein PtA15_1A308 [Puccinia triticina]
MPTARAQPWSNAGPVRYCTVTGHFAYCTGVPARLLYGSGTTALEKTAAAPAIEDYDAGSESDYGNADEELLCEAEKTNPAGSETHAKSTKLLELTEKGAQAQPESGAPPSRALETILRALSRPSVLPKKQQT